jgi:hypothetical protein
MSRSYRLRTHRFGYNAKRLAESHRHSFRPDLEHRLCWIGQGRGPYHRQRQFIPCAFGHRNCRRGAGNCRTTGRAYNRSHLPSRKCQGAPGVLAATPAAPVLSGGEGVDAPRLISSLLLSGPLSPFQRSLTLVHPRARHTALWGHSARSCNRDGTWGPTKGPKRPGSAQQSAGARCSHCQERYWLGW